VQRGVGEGLDEQHRVAVGGLHVLRQSAQCPPEDRGGEVRTPGVGQDAVALVVGHVAQTAQLLCLVPADEALTGAERERGGAEADERDPVLAFGCDVTQDATEELVAEEMVLVEERVEARNLVRPR
jgi:hypothetical protein